MKSILEKLRTNDWFFALLLVTAAILPVLIKLMLTGLLGSNFHFYFVIVWIPFVAICFAMLRGWIEVSLTAVLLLVAFILSLVSYPFDPDMDFRRQIVFESEIYIEFAVVISVAVQVALRKRRLKAPNK